MKRIFFQLIHRMSVLEFLTFTTMNSELNLKQLVNKTAVFFYYHISLLFGRNDLAFVMNLIYELEQTPSPLPSATVREVLSSILTKPELIPPSILVKVKTELQKLHSLPLYSNLSSDGMSTFRQFLTLSTFDDNILINAKAHPSVFFFKKLFTNLTQIASVLETFGGSIPDKFLFNSKLPTQLLHAAALNPGLIRERQNKIRHACSTQESIVEFFYAKDFVELYMPSSFLQAEKPPYAAGLVFRAFLQLGNEQAAQRVLLEQNSFGRAALRYYRDLISQPKSKPTNIEIPWLTTPIAENLSKLLPLQSMIALQSTSKRCRQLFKIPKKRLDFLKNCFELGNRYELQLREFRNRHTKHLHLISADFISPMLLTFLLSEFVLSFVSLSFASWIRILVFQISFFVFSVFKNKKQLFDNNESEIKHLDIRARLLYEFAFNLHQSLELISIDPNTPWNEVERDILNKELDYTMKDLTYYIHSLRDELAYLPIFYANPSSHLTITYTNTFFQRDILKPYRRLLLLNNLPEDDLRAENKALRYFLDTH